MFYLKSEYQRKPRKVDLKAIFRQFFSVKEVMFLMYCPVFFKREKKLCTG